MNHQKWVAIGYLQLFGSSPHSAGTCGGRSWKVFDLGLSEKDLWKHQSWESPTSQHLHSHESMIMNHIFSMFDSKLAIFGSKLWPCCGILHRNRHPVTNARCGAWACWRFVPVCRWSGFSQDVGVLPLSRFNWDLTPKCVSLFFLWIVVKQSYFMVMGLWGLTFKHMMWESH